MVKPVGPNSQLLPKFFLGAPLTYIKNMCKWYWLYFCVFEFLTFSVADQVSIRVEGEEDEREVAPIIVIQTPDPLLRLQVYWSSMLSIVILCYRYPRPLTKGSGQLVLRQYPMFPIIRMFTHLVFTQWNCQVKWKSMVIRRSRENQAWRQIPWGGSSSSSLVVSGENCGWFDACLDMLMLMMLRCKMMTRTMRTGERGRWTSSLVSSLPTIAGFEFTTRPL